MSSRPATPTNDTTPQPQTEPIRRTRSQTRQLQLLDSRRDMIATAQYQGHNPYLHPPHHSLQDNRLEQSSMSSQPRDIFAPLDFSFDTSYNTSAVPSATFAVSSGGVEGRREAPEELKSGTYKQSYTQDSATSIHLRHSPSLEESVGQPSTENERAVDTPSASSKKKRTRTLTTSNQSSVLLALLAKTPFPTTAEREEVGRAIGLTARKVQVWFQNQRQKQKKSGQIGSLNSAPQSAVTSAPLPLSRQPGFSAAHAVRMGYHGQTSPTFSPSSIAPYPSGSGSRDPVETGQYNISPPPIGHAPPRGHVTEPYQTGTAYSRSFTEKASYYSLRPGRGPGNDQYVDSSASTSNQTFTGHPGLSPSTYVTGGFTDPFGHHPPHSREPSAHSFGYPPPSQDPSLSDDQSRPTTSRGSQPYGPSSAESWRSKPLPALPSEPARPSTGQSINWEQPPPEHTFRPQIPPPRSRAFSNPDTTLAGYGSGRTYVPTPATAGLTPSSAYPPSRFYTPTMPQDVVAPGTYHAPLDYHHEEVQRLRHHTSSGSVGESQYPLRYGDHYTSPGGVSSSSSLSYSEQPGLGIPPASQHTGSATYSPVEQRRTRLSYDSSLASGQVLGKRAWSTKERRPTKRARTDDGHASMPLRSSTRALPPNTYQPQTAGQATRGAHEMHLHSRLHPQITRSEDPHHHYHYEAPSDPSSGV